MPDASYWTPEKREEQRQRALALKEEGKWGGAVGGRASGEARRRASGSLSERIEDPETVDEMWDALKAGLDKRQPIAVRQRTVDRMLKIAEEERKALKEERREDERQSREELFGSLAGAFIEALGRRPGDVDTGESFEIIEGTARELTVGSDGEEREDWSAD